MMDENLYQRPKLSTSSLPLSVLMSADHGDPKAIDHCVMIAVTHAHACTHTEGDIISQLKRGGINEEPICFMKNSSL